MEAQAMDCDRVFMILTRGPFPTGEPWDEEVEAHLERCEGCWRLADALRPALEVFQEAVPAAESRDLPGYWGDARPASHVVAGLARGTARTALVTGVRRACRPQRRSGRSGTPSEFSSEAMRTIAVAATVTATALAVVLLLRG
jgi:hypothetical protein